VHIDNRNKWNYLLSEFVDVAAVEFAEIFIQRMDVILEVQEHTFVFLIVWL
jgi:hypothetical protein